VQNQYAPEAVLVFGNTGFGKNLQGLSRNSPIEVNGMQIMVTDDLAVLEKNKEKKAELWASLQKMFKLK
jgi:hypothetical protein